MSLKRGGENSHDCRCRKSWKFHAGSQNAWDVLMDYLSKQILQVKKYRIFSAFNLIFSGKSANQKMLLARSLNPNPRNYQMKQVLTPSMELLLLVHPARWNVCQQSIRKTTLGDLLADLLWKVGGFFFFFFPFLAIRCHSSSLLFHKKGNIQNMEWDSEVQNKMTLIQVFKLINAFQRFSKDAAISFTCFFDSDVIKCQFSDAFLFFWSVKLGLCKEQDVFLCPLHPYFLKFSFLVKLRAIQCAED